MPDKVSGNPNVFSEARARKKGGKVCAPDGAMAKQRADRPRRASGGGVGSNKSPLSSAHGTGGGGGSNRKPLSTAHGVTSPSKRAN